MFTKFKVQMRFWGLNSRLLVFEIEIIEII